MKGSLDNRSKKRTKLFVGRDRELKLLDEWLDDPKAPFKIFSISGMGGIGKSSLMAEMLWSVKERNVLGIWLDGRSCTPTPVGFLEYLSATIGLETWDQSLSHPLEPLQKAGPEHRMVLCIDNYESLAILEGWLMEAFMPKLPSTGIAILFASRSELSLTWKTHPVWYRLITELTLENLSYEETVVYITSVGSFHLDKVGKMAHASDGHPLALALTVEAAMKQKELSGTEKMVLSQTISGHVLRELTTPELQPMVDVLIVLHYANQEMLSLVLGKPVALRQYQMLQRMSFIRTELEGLALHDLARMHLLRDFRLREPVRLKKLRTKAVTLLYQQLQTSDRSKHKRIASQMLFLCKDVFPLHRLYVDLTVDWYVTSLETIHEGDLPALHELLRVWCEYSIDPWQSDTYHRFLDDIALSFPESIAVLRGSDGKPVAMAITVLLHAKTSSLLNEYFHSELLECCDQEELSCEPDQADTYFPVLVAATNEYPGYTREELVGLLTLERLSLLGDGSRAVLVATNDHLKVFLQQLGFRLRPTSTHDCDTSFAQADVLELDFRHNNFGDWIMSFFQKNPEKRHLPLSVDLTEKEVRKLLSSLHAPAELQEFVPFFSDVDSGIELQKHILSLLKSETSRLSEPARTILFLTYYTHANNRIAAGQACNMSKATFYRHLQKAVSNFTEMLKNQRNFET